MTQRLQRGVIGFGLMLFATSSATAALPPAAQRQAERDAITAHPDVAARLAPRRIERIEEIGQDLYRVTAGSCSLDVRIVDMPWTGPGMPPPGGRRFGLEISQPRCQ